MRGIVLPNLRRLAETFVQIPTPATATAIAVWQGYLDLLRFKVAPVLRRLTANRTITWYCFLVHDRTTGVPTQANDPNPYIHLRVQLGTRVRLADLQKRLPADFTMTRMVQQPVPDTMDAARVSALRQGHVRHGWDIISR